MTHRATLAGGLSAAFIFVFFAAQTPAFAAPATKPAPATKARPAAKPAEKPAASPAATPAVDPTAKPVGKASAGEPAPAPMAEPDPAAEPPPAGGATTPPTPGDADGETRVRVNSDHSMTSILVPLGFFLCILLLVGTIQYMGFRKDRSKHQTLRLMVEKGAQIPPELITPQKRRGSDLRRGLVLVGAGLGIGLFLLMTKDARNSGAFGLGLIPALIGAGYLLAWKLEGRNKSDEPAATPTYTPGASRPTQPDETDNLPTAE